MLTNSDQLAAWRKIYLKNLTLKGINGAVFHISGNLRYFCTTGKKFLKKHK